MNAPMALWCQPVKANGLASRGEEASSADGLRCQIGTSARDRYAD
ncbi:hypothetical protein [Thermophilibacter provencensis]